jgi:hypothetical protein
MRRCIDFLRISGSGSIVMFPIYSSGAPFSISLTKRNPGNPNHARPSIIQLVPPSLVLSTVWLSSLTPDTVLLSWKLLERTGKARERLLGTEFSHAKTIFLANDIHSVIQILANTRTRSPL